MSYTLILNAGTASPVNLVVQSAGEGPPIEIGSVTPSFNGADRSSVRGVKRNFGALVTYVDTATKSSIIDILKNGRQIPCSGDLLGNIQTQMTMRYTGARMIAGPALWEVGLAGNEVQPNVVLLKYAPGDTITGESFTRSTTAYQNNGNIAAPLTNISINVKRDTHYIASVRSTLLEDARTNSLLWSNDFNNAAWVKTTTTVGTGIADPAGGTTACTLTATGATADTRQVLSAGSSIVRTNSIWARRRTGTGTVQIFDPPLGAAVSLALTTNWQRFSITGAASTVRDFVIQIITSGDAIDVWCAQLEDGAFKSSEIPTSTVAVTRGADSYSLPFTTPPQEMTVYAKFVEGGTITVNAAGVAEISTLAGAEPILLLYNNTALYSLYHGEGGAGSALAQASGGIVIGQTVELAGRLYGDGSVQIAQSVNAGAESLSAQSAAKALGTAWSAANVFLNVYASTFIGFTALQSFKIVAGARSLSEMRAL